MCIAAISAASAACVVQMYSLSGRSGRNVSYAAGACLAYMCRLSTKQSNGLALQATAKQPGVDTDLQEAVKLWQEQAESGSG